MKWRSDAKFKQKETDGGIFDLKEYGIRVTIHKIHGLGDNFYLSSIDFGFSQRDLNTDNFDEAVEKSKNLIIEKATQIYNAAMKFSEDDSENEFTRY